MTFNVVGRCMPYMEQDVLEKILEHLPEPDYVKVVLYGGEYNLDSIQEQCQEIVPGIELEIDETLELRLKNPTKKQLLEINEKTSNKQQGERGYQFIEVKWNNIEGSQAKLSYNSFQAYYGEKEPEYVSKIKEVIREVPKKMRVSYSNSYHVHGLNGVDPNAPAVVPCLD